MRKDARARESVVLMQLSFVQRQVGKRIYAVYMDVSVCVWCTDVGGCEMPHARARVLASLARC